MKKKTLIKIIKAVAFIVVFSLLFSYVTFLFKPKTTSPTADMKCMDQYYHMPKNRLELLFLGNSQISCGTDVMYLYEKYGIASFAFGGGSNPFLINYYQMLEAMRQHPVKAVVLDVSCMYNYDLPSDAAYRRNLDGMHFSVNKVRAIRDYIQTIETPENEKYKPYEMMLSYLFPLYNYHSRWNELDKADFDNDLLDDEHYNGYFITEWLWEPDVSYEKFIINKKQKEQPEWVRREQLEYLLKMIETCQSHNTELLLIKTPKKSWIMPGHNYVQQIADDHGLTFIDFNEDKNLKAMGYDYYQDMRDKDHLNARGAIKMTEYIAAYLRERVSFTDYRDSRIISDKMLQSYDCAVNRCFLNSSNSPQRYLEELVGKDYTVTIQANGDLTSDAYQTVQQQLTDLGLQIDLQTLKKQNYLAVLQNGKVVSENWGEEDLYYSLCINSQTEKEVKLLSSQQRNITKVFKTNYNFAQGGLCICVFDNVSGDFISRVSLYEQKNQLVLRRKKILLKNPKDLF